MAKPFSVHSKEASSSTSSAKTYLADCSPPSASSRPRRHRQPRPRTDPSPSSGVLTALAAICASTVAVHGRPIDAQPTGLPFLYPFTHDPATNDDDASADPERLVDHTLRTDAAPTSTPIPQLENRSSVADKYIQGTDGLWRKMNEWSLYGSTVCSGPCPTPAEGAATISSEDHSSDPPDSSPINDVNLDSLPSGWKPNDSSERDLTTVIIALSLVLAVLIIAFMVGSVFWRRKRRRYVQKDMQRDIEKKARRREGRSDCGSDDEDAESIRQAKVTQRKWARATSRWRANIRYSARRRRTMRTSNSNASQEVIGPAESDSTFVDPPASSPSHSRPPSRTPSRQSAAASDHSNRSGVPSPTGSSTNLPTISPSTSISAPVTDIPRPVSPLPISDPSYHPPAYRPSTPPPSHTQATAHPVYASPSYEGPAHPIPSSSKLTSIPPPPLDDGSAEDDSHHPPSNHHAGHVATDDKDMLARMAAMSSAPPVEDTAGYYPHPSASVPPLNDISELPFEDSSRAPSPYAADEQPPYSPPRSGLPPPPDKGKMAAKYDDYPYSLEQDMDFEDVEPEPGPSAPPFEDAGPSAPPFEESGPSAPPFESSMEPSAPPLHDDELVPSAPPPWEDEGVGVGIQDAREVTELSPAGPPGPGLDTEEHGPEIVCAATDRPP